MMMSVTGKVFFLFIKKKKKILRHFIHGDVADGNKKLSIKEKQKRTTINLSFW